MACDQRDVSFVIRFACSSMAEEQNFPQDLLFPDEKKIVVVGHKGCGKTSLIAAFVAESPADTTGTVPIRKRINFGRREWVHVVLLEGNADPHHSFYRNMDSSIALVCFAFDDIKSIGSVPEWIDDVKLFCSSAVLMVVGCKLDLKHKSAVPTGPSPSKEWMDLERAIVPYRYLECSAKTGEGVSHLVSVVGHELVKLSDKLSNDSSVQH